MKDIESPFKDNQPDVKSLYTVFKFVGYIVNKNNKKINKKCKKTKKSLFNILIICYHVRWTDAIKI